MCGLASSALSIVFFVLKICLLIVLCIFLFQLCKCMFNAIRNCPSGVKRRKLFIVHMYFYFRSYRFWSPIEFIKWVVIDTIRGKDRFKLFGIWCFTGYFGEGKSLGAVTYAKRIQKGREKVGQHWHIYTNFNMRGQDGKITCWEDLLNLPRYTIVVFDEIQSTFMASQKYNAFPIELLWKLTQCRKSKLVVFASSPVFHRMSIQLRENTDMVVKCKNMLSMDRWFRYAFYRAVEYEQHQGNPLKLWKAKMFTFNLISQDRDYKAYNTEETVDRFDVEEGKDKKINRNDYSKLKNEILKLVDEKIQKIA